LRERERKKEKRKRGKREREARERQSEREEGILQGHIHFHTIIMSHPEGVTSVGGELLLTFTGNPIFHFQGHE
jgi:hypothetical protein